MSIPYIIKPDSATLFVNGRGKTVANDHINFKKIVELLESEDCTVEQLDNLINVVKSLGVPAAPKSPTASQHDITFDKQLGILKYKGHPLAGYVATKALEMHQKGAEKPLLRFLAFLENLYQNPRNSIAERLYRFLEVGNMPITDDGYFLAYKKVRENFKDIHSNTMDNKIGTVVEMPRVLVNDKDTETCSTGLHFCSHAYLGKYASTDASTDRIVVLKINPADVVSIPTDYNDTKGRCCKYEVLSEITDEARRGHVFTEVIAPASAYRTEMPKPVPTPSMHFPAAVVAVPVDYLHMDTDISEDYDEDEEDDEAEYRSVLRNITPRVETTTTTVKLNVTPAPVPPVTDLSIMLGKLTSANQAHVYNQFGSTGAISHFRDKATGIKRLTDVHGKLDAATRAIFLQVVENLAAK